MGTEHSKDLYRLMGTLAMRKAMDLGTIRNRISIMKTLQEIEEETQAAQTTQAAEDEPPWQDADDGTRSSEQVPYIHNPKRETATQHGGEHMAHKPAGLFETPANGTEQAAQVTTDQVAAGPSKTEAVTETSPQATAGGGADAWEGAHKPDDIFGCKTVEADPPDWSAGEARAEPPEPEQDTPDMAQGVERVIDTTVTKMAERIPDVVWLALQEAQASLEALTTRNKDTGVGKQNISEAPQAQEVQGMQATKKEEMKPEENPHKDFRLNGSRYGEGW